MLFSIYGGLLFSYLASQIFFSELERRKERTVLDSFKLETEPHVAILLPYFREDLASLCATINSIKAQSYQNFSLVVMNDGDPNEVTYDNLKAMYSNDHRIVFAKQVNAGKRAAQFAAAQLAPEYTRYFLTIDSDTVLDVNAVNAMVCTAEASSASAVSGAILVKPQGDFLNKLLHSRYWLSNFQERRSQAFFNQMLCCSGPLCLWSAELFRKVGTKYIGQTFLGSRCTYGDDRHLTNLFLEEGAIVKFASNAKALTATPESLSKWFKQQERWSKSFYRESWWSLKILWNKIWGQNKANIGLYFVYANLMSFLLPFILISNIVVHLATAEDVTHYAVLYLASVFVAGWMRSIYALGFDRNWRHLLAPLYGLLHFAVFFIRIKAIFKLKDTRWGTR